MVPGLTLGLTLSLTLGLTLGLVLGALPGPARAASPGSPVSPVARSVSAGTVQDVVPTRLLVQRLLEDRVLALTNVERRKHGCRALRSNAYLRKAARGHTVTMALRGLMSHQLPGEAYFSKRITRAGYRGWSNVAENVARGFSGPSAVVRAWMASPGHRRNILNCRLRDLGVGVVHDGGQLWWTQNFGRKW